MATKVYNVSGGTYSGAAFSAFENSQYGTCVANDSSMKCTAGTGNKITIAAGDCLIANSANYAFRAGITTSTEVSFATAPTVAGQSRYDAVVAYIDTSKTPTSGNVDNTDGDILRFACVSGTAATNPSKSAVNSKITAAVGSGNPYIILAYVLVPANVSSTANTTIEDARKVAGVRVTLSQTDIQPGSPLAPGMIYGVYR